MRTIRGGVLLTPQLGRYRNAVLHVRLLDVTRADAPATELDAVTVPAIDYTALTDEVVQFELTAPDWDPATSVSVSAHLDQSGRGDVVVGDALTTQAYDVNNRSDQDSVLVRLTAVGR
jgi:uncharacterized lipoprotein YbaY